MKPEECICYNCGEFKAQLAGEDYDCACESGPVYNEQACTTCQYKDVCDVPMNRMNYPLYIDDDKPCPECGNEVRGQGGYLSCECPAGK